MGPKVLITRPLEAAQTIAWALEQRFYHPIIDPLMEIVPIAFTLQAIPYDTILITSSNAVCPMAGVCDTRTPVLTVGAATCEAAIAAGFTTARCIGQTVEEAIQALVLMRLDALLYLSGTHITTEITLPGLQVTRVPVYDTREVDLEKTTIDLLHRSDIAWILLFSRRTAEAFSRVVTDMAQQGWIKDTGTVCLSERTAAPVRSLNWNRLVVAAKPTADAMIAALPMINGPVIA